MLKSFYKFSDPTKYSPKKLQTLDCMPSTNINAMLLLISKFNGNTKCIIITEKTFIRWKELINFINDGKLMKYKEINLYNITTAETQFLKQ